MQVDLVKQLQDIHSALDAALGDTDVDHIEDDIELRERHPVQWAAQKVAFLIAYLSVRHGPGVYNS